MLGRAALVALTLTGLSGLCLAQNPPLDPNHPVVTVYDHRVPVPSLKCGALVSQALLLRKAVPTDDPQCAAAMQKALEYEQEYPQTGPTPHWIHAPSPRVIGTPVLRHYGQKGPLPGMSGPKPFKIGITIDGWPFEVPLGSGCAAAVAAAIQCHADLFTGDKKCDST